jgi:hypothetical protein
MAKVVEPGKGNWSSNPSAAKEKRKKKVFAIYQKFTVNWHPELPLETYFPGALSVSVP